MIVYSKEIVTFNDKTGVVFVDFACENTGLKQETVVREIFLPQEINFNQCVGVAVLAVTGKKSSGFKVSVPAEQPWGLALMNTDNEAPIVLGGAFSRPFQMGESGSGQVRFSMNMARRYASPYRGRAKVRIAFNVPAGSVLALTAAADIIK